MTKIQELIEAGKIITIVKYYEGSTDTIKYTDKHSGQPAEIRQIKLAVNMQAGKGRKIVNAVMRVPDGEDPSKVLAGLGLQEGGRVILDIDSLQKHPPATKGAESTWGLRIHSAFPLEPAKDATAEANPQEVA